MKLRRENAMKISCTVLYHHRTTSPIALLRLRRGGMAQITGLQPGASRETVLLVLGCGHTTERPRKAPPYRTDSHTPCPECGDTLSPQLEAWMAERASLSAIPIPGPRYDETFFRGVEWLDSL
jgi:hypothetical protein